MGDLISRKAIVNEISYKFGLGDSVISNTVRIIKNHPTAFDVEKVIQQINDAIMPAPEHRHKFCGTVEPEHCVKYENCEDCMAERMIEIVEKGGV